MRVIKMKGYTKAHSLDLAPHRIVNRHCRSAQLWHVFSHTSDTVSRMHDAQVAQSDQFKSHLDNLTGSVDRFVQAHQRAQGETDSGISTEYRAANHDLHGTPVPTVPGDDRKNGQDTDNSGHDNSIMGATSACPAEWPPLPAVVAVVNLHQPFIRKNGSGRPIC